MASATVTCSQRRRYGPAFNIPEFQDMKWWASSMSGQRCPGWKIGQRAGVGWHGGHDGTCRECRRGDFRNCQNLKVAGISYDGGYQQYMVAPRRRGAIPETLRTPKRHRCCAPGIPPITRCGTVARCPATLSRFRASAVSAISQFNSRTSLVTRWRLLGAGPTDAPLARKLGASVYIDNKSTNAARHCRNWAAHRSSWRRPRAQRL